MKKNLVLTGMMGVGKSTVGKNLAQKLSYNFVDIDRTIESREGSTINLIFKNKSESYFRKLENEISLEKLKKKNTVISLGGGAFLNKSIRREIKNTSVSFWLDVDVSELIKRLKKTKKRPLLYNKNLSVTVNKIYLERKKTYSEADFRIKCNFLGPDKIVDKILKLYEKSGN
ncbi:shikimate kinase [Candidatus Pelagibacter bacterium]|nr:shikimate kinase [Candidatus Pelagibacter bacterium]